MCDFGPQFESGLGGAETLPKQIKVTVFVANRSQEIQIMKNHLAAQSGTKLAFQTLPNHMRRRAMSHNAKRLPRRLRLMHINQMRKSGPPTTTKRNSRRYRRRPRNLEKEYARRSNKRYRWLNTHIWHAKRFRMIEKWGYKLAERPCDKAFRALYRAVAQHCMLQDISYVNCIEIRGARTAIVNKIKELTVNTGCLGVGAKTFAGGLREGEIVLGLEEPIGPVNFQWQPQSGPEAVLWIWAHASYYSQTLTCLVKAFFLTLTQKKYVNVSNTVILSELRHDLCRFRLMGPLANAVLHDAFILSDVPEPNQHTYWSEIENVGSVAEISPHIVLSLTVKDPRFNIPEKRKKIVTNLQHVAQCGAPACAPISALGEESARLAANRSFISYAEINKFRSEMLVPGTDYKAAASVPILLVQRPGTRDSNIGFGSGWDIIIPSVWAKPFWIAIIMRGARVGGLRESSSVLFEMGHSLLLAPDTKAGELEEQHISQQLQKKFFQKPPNKRTNFNKFNIASPLRWNWKLLIGEWSDSSTPITQFSVIRDKTTLNEIQKSLTSRTPPPQCPKDALIPVRLVCETRGAPQAFAVICLPENKADFKSTFNEPHSEDKLQAQRKSTRTAHQTLLKKLRRNRKKVGVRKSLDEEHAEILDSYTKKMRALWLPEPTTVRKSCAREVIGFVTMGGFSYSLGKSGAVGYIAAGALPHLVKSQFKNRILVRNCDTRQYREAKVSVIVE